MAVKQALLWNEEFMTFVAEVPRAIVESLRRSGTVFFLGNGGSAGDAQDLAAELVGRCLRERQSLAGLARSLMSAVFLDRDGVINRKASKGKYMAT